MQKSYKKFLVDNLLKEIKEKHEDCEIIGVHEIKEIALILNENNVKRGYTVEATPIAVDLVNTVIAEYKKNNFPLPEGFNEPCIEKISLSWASYNAYSYTFYLSIIDKNNKKHLIQCADYLESRDSAILRIIQPILGNMMEDLFFIMADPNCVPLF